MEIGAQFYTLREKCTNLKDFADTLARVADIGYKTVQISGVCAYEPEWLRDELKKNDLRCVLTHFSPDEIKEKPLDVVKKHKIFDCTNIGVGGTPGGITEKDFDNFIRDYKQSAKIIKENGAQFFYHNHYWEFQKDRDGKFYLDKLLDAFEPSELQITLDTYWATYAGVDLMDLISSLKGRLSAVHLKDFKMLEREQRMAVVGEGNINFEKIIPHLGENGARYLLVEQDDTYGECPLECLKRSYKNLKALGL